MPFSTSEIVPVNGEFASPEIIIDSGSTDLLAQFLSDVATAANTTETDANAYTVTVGTLAANGDTLRRIDAFVIAATPGNTKRIRTYFGATTVFDSTVTAHSGGALVVETVVTRINATSQKCFARVISSGGGTPMEDAAAYALASETLSGSVTFRATMQNGTAAAGDITAKLTNIYKDAVS